MDCSLPRLFELMHVPVFRYGFVCVCMLRLLFVSYEHKENSEKTRTNNNKFKRLPKGIHVRNSTIFAPLWQLCCVDSYNAGDDLEILAYFLGCLLTFVLASFESLEFQPLEISCRLCSFYPPRSHRMCKAITQHTPESARLAQMLFVTTPNIQILCCYVVILGFFCGLNICSTWANMVQNAVLLRYFNFGWMQQFRFRFKYRGVKIFRRYSIASFRLFHAVIRALHFIFLRTATSLSLYSIAWLFILESGAFFSDSLLLSFPFVIVVCSLMEQMAHILTLVVNQKNWGLAFIFNVQRKIKKKGKCFCFSNEMLWNAIIQPNCAVTLKYARIATIFNCMDRSNSARWRIIFNYIFSMSSIFVFQFE